MKNRTGCINEQVIVVDYGYTAEEMKDHKQDHYDLVKLIERNCNDSKEAIHLLNNLVYKSQIVGELSYRSRLTDIIDSN